VDDGGVSDVLRSRGIPDHLAVATCADVLDGARPVLYVTRADGGWQFLCGEPHEDRGSIRVVGISHMLDADPTLVDVLDLHVEEDADRASLGSGWVRKQYR
jgi:hypothetical protein